MFPPTQRGAAVPACPGVSHTSPCTLPSRALLLPQPLQSGAHLQRGIRGKRSFYGGLLKVGLFCLSSPGRCTRSEQPVMPWDAVDRISTPVGIWMSVGAHLCQPQPVLFFTCTFPCTGSSWCHRFLCSALHLCSSLTSKSGKAARKLQDK